MKLNIELSDINKKSFCILPWLHLFINEAGAFYPCCFAHDGKSMYLNDDGDVINASEKDSILNAWNSDQANKTRLDMLKGKRPVSCKTCFMAEDSKMLSNRLHSNRRFKKYINYSVEQTKEDGSISIDNIVSADIRLGNLCNLACRMCSPLATKKIIPEYRKIWRQEDIFHFEENMDWYKQVGFWNEFFDSVKNVERIHLAGGEPFIIKKGIQFLQKLVETGKSKDIILSYNTNLTIIPKEFYNLWPKFKSIILTISLDGVGAINEYIRWPSKWDEIDKNIKQIERDWDKLNISAASIHSVVMAYNVSRIHELCEYTKTLTKIIPYPMFDFVQSIEYCDPRILPTNLKELVKANIESYLPRLRKHDELDYSEERKNLKNQLEAVIEYIFSEDRSNQLEQFRWYTSVFDEHRKQSLHKFIPELACLMEFKN